MFGHCPAIAGGSRDDAAGTVEVVSSLNAAVLIKSSQLRIGALIALRVSPALGGERAAGPFPALLSPLAASFLRCAPDRFLLTKPNTSCTIEMPASLRSDGVRDHPGMPFGILPDLVFGFVGIPTDVI